MRPLSCLVDRTQDRLGFCMCAHVCTSCPQNTDRTLEACSHNRSSAACSEGAVHHANHIAFVLKPSSCMPAWQAGMCCINAQAGTTRSCSQSLRTRHPKGAAGSL